MTDAVHGASGPAGGIGEYVDPAVLDVLPAGYRDLFHRVRAVSVADERIRGLWLSGSLARGAADGGSDLDVVLAVRDKDFADFADGWREWLASITDVLIARSIPNMPGSFYSLTTDCLRLDVVAEAAGTLPESPFRYRIAVYDPDELGGQVPSPDEGEGPDRDRLYRHVEEFYRQLAIFPAAVVAREDWLLGTAGVTLSQRTLYDLFVESNQPLPPTGVKQFSAKLNPEQRQVLQALPVPNPNRDAVIAAMLETARAFATTARQAVEEHGVTWPGALERTVTAFVERELAD